MALTPVDISNKEFPVRMRGYDRDAVDDFLDRVVQEFEQLIRENASLREQIANLTQRLEQYQNLEQTINRTLVLAEQAAEEIKESARREADLLLSQTRAQVERMLENGQAKARQIMADNSDLIRVVETLRTQVRALLQSQLEALDALPDPLSAVAAAQFSDAREARPDDRRGPASQGGVAR
ncbi:cell division initiation protein [Symbiobacterium terraclitae]|uniref:Cell division initiation protein n=1 Tax=Symbiobacterium terraclitae TaxID=557451 RepID=A0ABS4JQ78_9FIRM|nr:DivIVA domain-containing protein [Symbiobacterium terraclitae]MBP2017136.1 cell division initiation protein [Symbiobacterium terraclitae]